MTVIEELRRKIAGEEFDYQFLSGLLSNYDRPRDKISAMLRQKAIIRIKKGIYIFGPTYARKPFSKEILANMIYGPSYVSLDYALHYYGLIPEKVETVTSVTCGRGRQFTTPVGQFTYKKILLKAYSIGMKQVNLDKERIFLVATPEKALADKICSDRGSVLHNQSDMKNYLLTHLRIDSEELVKMNPTALNQMAAGYRSRKVRLLSSFVRRFKERKRT